MTQVRTTVCSITVDPPGNIMNAWIGIIGTVIGTFIGGGAAWLNSRFQLRHQTERDRKTFMLQKLEEIHQLLSQYKHSYKMLTAEFLRTFASGQQEFGDLEPIPSERLKMLIGFYAPDLATHLKKVEEQGEGFGELIGKHVLLGESDQSAQKKSLGFLLMQSGEIGRACEEMQQEVIQLAKSYI